LLGSSERFSAGVDLYERFRPSYPAALVEWVVARASLEPGARIADLGCGTGISTRLFAERGFDVVGIDPNEEMLARARRAGGARYRRGEAAATGLPDASVDLVIAGQAFHWFDVQKTLDEALRILRPGRRLAAFWNLRGASPFLSEYDALLRRASREYEVLLKPEQAIAAIAAEPRVRDWQRAEFPNSQRFDREGLLGRAFSSSYVQHGLDDRDSFERALFELFDRHQQSGCVEFAYRSVAVSARLMRG
jgi:SAM-dependent methyltransferase